MKEQLLLQAKGKPILKPLKRPRKLDPPPWVWRTGIPSKRHCDRFGRVIAFDESRGVHFQDRLFLDHGQLWMPFPKPPTKKHIAKAKRDAHA